MNSFIFQDKIVFLDSAQLLCIFKAFVDPLIAIIFACNAV